MNIRDLSLEKTYIIGVSGGPDSMALLDIAYKWGLQLVVAHVNYKRRPTADHDMMIVRDYCLGNNIVFEYRLVGEHTGNFQEWARNQRYQLFRDLAQNYQVMGVLIAHHQDDLIETFLLQKQRKQIPLHWGLKAETVIDGLKIYRPLLSYTKLELVEYCISNGILYGKDESNASDAYTRNRIRHQTVDNFSISERQTIIEKIDRENESLIRQRKLIEVSYNDIFIDQNLAKLKNLKIDVQTEVIRKYLMENEVDARRFSPSYLKEIANFFVADSSKEIKIDNMTLATTYGKPVIFDKRKLSYHYLIDKIEHITTIFFAVSDHGKKINGVTIADDDLPLTIRNWQPDDKIKLRFGHKKINRWFIDRKIPLNQRFSWPIILNRHQEIILVPEIGCNVAHFSNNPNMFVLKL